MKKVVLSNLMKIIKNNNDYTEEKLEEIEYGLESIYLTFSKLIIIFLISHLLGILKEVILLSVFYNIIRITAYGLHASKSIQCLLMSTTMFLGGVYICNYIRIALFIKVIISLLCIYCIYKYAPADTHKRPLVNAKKRKKLKIISLISATVFTILIIACSDNLISNYLLVGMIESVIMIHPLSYKILKLPYDNYKNYNYGV